jgi:hypothetical protein
MKDHLQTRTVLDYLEGRLDAAQARRLEEHLAGPCRECRERVAAAARLVDLMRSDRSMEPDPSLRGRALDVFAEHVRPDDARGWIERAAALLFDSVAAPAPVLARRAVGDVRRLRYALGTDELEIEIEPVAEGLFALRGQLVAPDPPACRVHGTAGGEAFEARVDADGLFAAESLPGGAWTLTVETPEAAYRLPEFQP